MLQEFIEAFGTTIDLRAFMVRMVASAFLAFAAAWMSVRLQPAGSHTGGFLRLLPLLALTMALVTTVVASSLAIAIGMVGAMSVVRFRNILQSTQELVLVLIALALGLCAGIGEIWLAVLTLPILGIVLFLQRRSLRETTWIIHLSGQPKAFDQVVKELRGSYPQLRVRHCTHTPAHGEWSFAHPLLSLPDLLRLRDFLQLRAPSLKISWEHAPEA